MGPHWCATIGWRIIGNIPLLGTLWHLLELSTPFNPPSWARKALVGYQTWVSRLVPQRVFCLEVRVPRWYPQKGDQ